LYRAAEQAGISDWTVLEHRKKDPEFGRLVDEAKQRWVDEVLIREATRRAVEGCNEPLLGGKNRDEVVAHRKVYSDGLLTTFLRANRSEFRDGSENSGGASGSSPVMFIPSAVPTTMDDWEKQCGEDAKGQRGQT